MDNVDGYMYMNGHMQNKKEPYESIFFFKQNLKAYQGIAWKQAVFS